MGGVKVTKATVENTILFNGEPYVAVSVIVANTGVNAGTDGRKVIKAGTPLTGDLTDRTAAFAVATIGGEPAVSNAVGLALHDMDVTDGNENGSLLVFGFVNHTKVADLVAAHTDALKHIVFIA